MSFPPSPPLDTDLVTNLKNLEMELIVANSEKAALRLQLSELQASAAFKSTHERSESSVVDLMKALLEKVSKELVERSDVEESRRVREEEEVSILQEMLEESRTALRHLQAAPRRNSLADNALDQQSRRLSLLGPSTRNNHRRKSSDDMTPRMGQHTPTSNDDSGKSRTMKIPHSFLLPFHQNDKHQSDIHYDYPATPPSAPLRTQGRKQSFACFDDSDLPPPSGSPRTSSSIHRVPAPAPFCQQQSPFTVSNSHPRLISETDGEDLIE